MSQNTGAKRKYAHKSNRDQKINEEGKINEGGRFQGMTDVSML
jgi:hypothetical protein